MTISGKKTSKDENLAKIYVRFLKGINKDMSKIDCEKEAINFLQLESKFIFARILALLRISFTETHARIKKVQTDIIRLIQIATPHEFSEELPEIFKEQQTTLQLSILQELASLKSTHYSQRELLEILDKMYSEPNDGNL